MQPGTRPTSLLALLFVLVFPACASEAWSEKATRVLPGAKACTVLVAWLDRAWFLVVAGIVDDENSAILVACTIRGPDSEVASPSMRKTTVEPLAAWTPLTACSTSSVTRVTVKRSDASCTASTATQRPETIRPALVVISLRLIERIRVAWLGDGPIMQAAITRAGMRGRCERS